MIEIILFIALGYSIGWCLDNIDKVKEIWAIIKR